MNGKISIGDTVVVITTPRLTFSDNQLCLLRLIAQYGVRMYWASGVFWEQGLEATLEEALRNGCKYIVTMDYDTLFEPSDVVRLRELAESHPEAAAIIPLQLRRESSIPLFCYGEGAEPDQKIPVEEFAKDLFPVMTGHFGLTLLRADVLAGLPKPWFLPIPAKNGAWSREITRQDGGKLDADMYFWFKLKECGHQAYLAPKVMVGHCELVVKWPGKNLEPLMQQLGDYNARGAPKEELLNVVQAGNGTEVCETV